MVFRYKGIPSVFGPLASTLSGFVASVIGTYTSGIAGAMTSALSQLQMSASGSAGLPVSSSDITSISITNTSVTTKTNWQVVFGQYFKQGDVPSTATVGVKIGASAIACDVHKKATYSDGSLRHAIITTLIPSLSGSATQSLTIYTQTQPGTGPLLTKASIIATAFDASVSIIVGGITYSLTARELLDGSTPRTLDETWLSGQYCSEFVVGGRLKSGVVTHAHLAAYFHVRAYGSSGSVTRVRCDVIVENGWTFTAGSAAITENVTVIVGGSPIYTNASLTQYHHTRWSVRGFWGGSDDVRVVHDRTYLKKSGAVPNYAPTTVAESVFTSYSSYTPMGIASLRQDWGAVGYHEQIGPMPEWAAAYCMSGDSRAFDAEIANSRAGGSYSYHYRDENTGYPPKITTYPALSYQGPEGGLVIGAGGNPNIEDAQDTCAHQPLIGFLAYTLTGDYAHLEEMHFLNAWNLLWNGSYGTLAYRLVGYQNRGRAWGLRSLGHVAAITPDNHPMKQYFVDEFAYNVDHYVNQCATVGGSYYNTLGVVYDPIANTDYAAWVGDFWATTAGRLAELGYASAVTLRNWIARWTSGRIGQGSIGYGYSGYYGAVYVFPTGGVNGGNPVWSSFGTFQTLFNSQVPLIDATPDIVPPGPNNYLMHAGAYPDQANAYYANFQAALAYSVDAGVAHPDTWRRFKQMGTPNYTTTPLWNIEPRFDPPAAITSLSQNQWYQFPNSNASAIDPCPANNCPYSGTNGFAAIMDGLSSGVYDTKRDRLVIFGGGHGNYGGNDVIAFSLRTGTWSMLIAPSINVALGASGYYTDGKPVSRHSYDQLQYSPDLDGLIAMGMSAGYPNAQSSNTIDFFSFETNNWSAKAAPTLGQLGYETYDCAYSGRDKDGHLYVHTAFGNGNRIYKFNISTQTWTAGSLLDYGYYANGGMKAAVDTKRNRLYVLGEGNSPRYRDLNNLNAAPVAWAGVPSAVNNTSGPGLDYDPVNDRLISWIGGQTVHVMNCATLAWSTLSIAPSSAVPPANGSRVFGRFRYVPSFHGAVVVQTTTGSVYFLKL